MKSINILGKDARSLALTQQMKDGDYVLEHYSKADIVVCPIPFTRDDVYINGDDIRIEDLLDVLKNSGNLVLVTGALKENTQNILKDLNIKYIDLMKDEEFIDKNAYITAEGTIEIIMQNTDKVIKGMKIGIIGYGRIGRKIAELLESFEADITVYTSKSKEVINNKFNVKSYESLIDHAKYNEVIINTAPKIFLTEDVLSNLNKTTLIVDIASGNGGTDFIKAKELGITAVWALSIPSKYAKNSAAACIKEKIDKITFTYK